MIGGVSSGAGAGLQFGHGPAAVLNDPPRAGGDTALRPAGLSVKVPVDTLLANDRDPEGHRLALARFDAVSAFGGRVSLDRGWLLYEPPPSMPDADHFQYTVEDSAGYRASTVVTVLATGHGPQPTENLVAITLLAGGQRLITFAGIPGRRYRIEWAGALPASSWEPLAIVEADSRGIIQWVDSTDPPPAQRYYRTAVP